MSVKNPFQIAFERRATDVANVKEYRTYFSVGLENRQFVSTKVDEAKVLGDGLTIPDVVASVKASHYNTISDLLHTALVKALGIKAE